MRHASSSSPTSGVRGTLTNPAITQLWENAWGVLVPFLDYDVEIRRVIYSTNAVESLNARYRRAIRARGHFPDRAAG